MLDMWSKSSGSFPHCQAESQGGWGSVWTPVCGPSHKSLSCHSPPSYGSYLFISTTEIICLGGCLKVLFPRSVLSSAPWKCSYEDWRTAASREQHTHFWPVPCPLPIFLWFLSLNDHFLCFSIPFLSHGSYSRTISFSNTLPLDGMG